MKKIGPFLLKVLRELRKPISYTFSIELIPKPINAQGQVIHDFALMFREHNENLPFVEDPRDLEAMTYDLSKRFKDVLNTRFAKVRYDNHEWYAIYIDLAESNVTDAND